MFIFSGLTPPPPAPVHLCDLCLFVLHLLVLFIVLVCAHTHEQVHMRVLAHTHVEVTGRLPGDSPLDQHPFHSAGYRYGTQVVRLNCKGPFSTHQLAGPLCAVFWKQDLTT